MSRSETEKTCLFIDMSNLFYASRAMNIRIDYKRLLEYFSRGRHLLRAFAYMGIDPANIDAQGLVTWMKRNGYRVVTKPLRRFEDGSAKANLDIELAIDMLTMAEHIDTAILISGDGDFTRLVEAVQFKGVRVEVVGLGEQTSSALIETADAFIELAEIVPDVQMVQRFESVRRAPANNTSFAANRANTPGPSDRLDTGWRSRLGSDNPRREGGFQREGGLPREGYNREGGFNREGGHREGWGARNFERESYSREGLPRDEDLDAEAEAQELKMARSPLRQTPPTNSQPDDED